MFPCLLKQRILNVKCNLFLITWDHQKISYWPCDLCTCSQVGRLDQREALLGVPFHQCPQRVNVCMCSASFSPDFSAKLAMSFSALFAESVSRNHATLLIVLLLVSSQLVWWNFRGKWNYVHSDYEISFLHLFLIGV